MVIKVKFMTLFKDSSIFFNNFLDRYNIILDHNCDKIIELYNKDTLNYGIYKIYFDVFENYIFLKSKIYIMYYILILYLLNETLIRKFCRYIISIFSKFNYIENKYKNLQIYNLTKNEILILLKEILCNNIDNKLLITKFFLFILCFQSYF